MNLTDSVYRGLNQHSNNDTSLRASLHFLPGINATTRDSPAVSTRFNSLSASTDQSLLRDIRPSSLNSSLCVTNSTSAHVFTVPKSDATKAVSQSDLINWIDEGTISSEPAYEDRSNSNRNSTAMHLLRAAVATEIHRKQTDEAGVSLKGVHLPRALVELQYMLQDFKPAKSSESLSLTTRNTNNQTLIKAAQLKGMRNAEVLLRTLLDPSFESLSTIRLRT